MTRTIPFVLFTVVLIAFSTGPTTHAQKQKAEPLPEGAQKKSVTIYCDGIKMQGDLCFPADFKKRFEHFIFWAHSRKKVPSGHPLVRSCRSA